LPNKGKLLIPRSGLRTKNHGCVSAQHTFVFIPHSGLRTWSHEKKQRISHFYVSIPHSGLETFEQVKLYAKPELSPSHTVGLEPDWLNEDHVSLDYVSPSHTVGLELL